MNLDDFKFGDAWWAYLTSHATNRNEIGKALDVDAEAREEEGAATWYGANNAWEGEDKEE